MHGLEAEYWGTVDFIYIDLEAHPDTADEFAVTYQPTFFLLNEEGHIVQQWFEGSERTIRSNLEGYLNP